MDKETFELLDEKDKHKWATKALCWFVLFCQVDRLFRLSLFAEVEVIKIILGKYMNGVLHESLLFSKVS